jgi:membrane protein
MTRPSTAGEALRRKSPAEPSPRTATPSRAAGTALARAGVWHRPAGGGPRGVRAALAEWRRAGSEPGAVAARRREPETARTWRELARALRRPRALVSAFLARVAEDDLTTQAAALAYYFFLSIFPLLLFVLALASVLPIRGLEGWLLENARRTMPAEAHVAVAGAVQSLLETPRGGLLSLGAVLALWTASAGFAALMAGLNRAYRVEDPRPWWRARLHALGLTAALSALMVLAFVLTLFGGLLVDVVTSRLGPVAGVAAFALRWGATLGAVMVVVAAVYYACPALERDWQWVRPGSAFFTFGFLAASSAFSSYVGRFGAYDKTYGSLGAIIILLLWMYILALFLLLGGELNALLEERLVGRGEAPALRPRGGAPVPAGRPAPAR